MGDDFDPWCDPAKPRKVTFEEITGAAYRIASGVVKTPCVGSISKQCVVQWHGKQTLFECMLHSKRVCLLLFWWNLMPSHMNSMTGCELYLKCEFLQYTGSFKERGARNAILRLSPELKQKGVIAASLGNHSQGLSYHGMLLKVPTTVVMPKVAPKMKINKCKSFGVNVIIEGTNMGEAKHHAMVLAKQKGYTYINGYDHPDIISGQGTVGLEIIEQVPALEAVLVPCGGGGLLAGIVIAIKHLRPHVLVYGVETDKSASMTTSLTAGKVVPYTIDSTLADGLAVGNVGVNSFHNIKPLVDKMVVVTEDWTARAILRIAELEKYVVEGGGAVCTAAILAGLVPELKGKKVVCVCSGGNIDTGVLASCFDRGLVNESRYVKFKVDIPNLPGSLAVLCTKLGDMNVAIRTIFMEHAWNKGSVFNVRVKIMCETSGPEHVQQLRSLIEKDYPEYYFPQQGAEDVIPPPPPTPPTPSEKRKIPK